MKDDELYYPFFVHHKDGGYRLAAVSRVEREKGIKDE